MRQGLQRLIKKYAPRYLYANSHSASTTSAGLVTRHFSLAFYNLPLTEGIREMRTEKIGKLVSVSGTVTRTTEVRPELLYGTFMCLDCRTVVTDVEQQFKYTEVRAPHSLSLLPQGLHSVVAADHVPQHDMWQQERVAAHD